MKKSLLAVALLGAFGVAGLAAAQTSVTMFGTIDAGAAYQHGANSAGNVISVESGQQSYSRIGFKGTEDLGRGMKAVFVLEQGIQIDTGNSGYNTLGSQIVAQDPFNPVPTAINNGTFSSQAYVGLSSKVGQITVGRQFTPLYEAYGEIDPFQNGFAANINNLFGTIGNASLHQRMDNAIIYHTPDNLHGLKGAIAYGFGEVAGSTTSESQIGASLGYSNGPLTAAYAFHHANNDAFGIESFKTNFIGATWNFKAAKVHVAFDQNEGTTTGSLKTQDYMAGVTVPFGKNSLFSDYTYKRDKVTDGANTNQFAIGYTYAISKRTNFYTAFSHVKNDTNAFVNTDTLGATVNTYQVGLRHMF